MIDYRATSLEQLAAMVRSKEVSSRELVEHSLAMIDRCAPLNAWVVVDPERALAVAAAVDEDIAGGRAVGPLAGIPIGVKDMEHAAGFRTGFGSLIHADDPPAQDDSVLTARLKAAGCVVLGKTTTPEHGWAGDTVSPLTGATLSPYDTTKSPGGSSGGTAASIAAGIVPLGTGSDGGGSIRLPASICGLTGLKPSHGRVPLGGPTPPGAGLLAVRGPMALRARDTASALAAVVGPERTDPFSLPAEDLDWRIPEHVDLPRRVVWCPGPDFPVDRGVAVACASAVRALEAAGTEVVTVDRLYQRPPLWDWWTLWTSYRNRAQGKLRGTPQWELIDPGLRADMDHAHEQVDNVRVMKAFDAVHHHNLAIESALAQGELLLTPTLASETAVSGHLGTVDGEETAQWAPFTQVCNMTRHPAGSVPCGTTAAGLPIGMQVIGPHHADVAVLRAMAAFETLWADACPPLPAW